MLLEGVRKLVTSCPSDFGADTEIANLVVSRRVATIAFDRVDDGVEVVECSSPTLSLCCHADTEVTSRPLSIRIF